MACHIQICGLVALKSLLLLSFQSMTSENLCETSPILAPLGEILCEPRRLWRHGSRAPVSQTEPKRKRSSIKQQTIGKRSFRPNHVYTIKSLSYSD